MGVFGIGAVRVDIDDALAVRRPCRAHLRARRVGQPLVPAGGEIDRPQVERAFAVAGIDQPVALGGPSGVDHHIGAAIGEPAGLAADRHDVEIAERGERHLPAIRRQHGALHADHRARGGRIEHDMALGVIGPAYLQVGGEGHDRLAAVRPAPVELAVGGVEQVAARQPGSAERVDILPLDEGLIVLHQHRLAIGDARPQHMLAIRRPGRGAHRHVHAERHHVRLGGERLMPLHVRDIDAGRAHPVRDIGDARAVRRPARAAVAAGAVAELPDAAVGDVARPDIELAVAAGGEGEPLAVRRPCRLALLIRLLRDRVRLRAVRGDQPDAVMAVAVRLEGDPLAVRRPTRLPPVVERVGDRGRRAAARGHDIEHALQIEHDAAAVRREREGEVGALGDRDRYRRRRLRRRHETARGQLRQREQARPDHRMCLHRIRPFAIFLHPPARRGLGCLTAWISFAVKS